MTTENSIQENIKMTKSTKKTKSTKVAKVSKKGRKAIPSDLAVLVSNEVAFLQKYFDKRLKSFAKNAVTQYKRSAT